MATTPENPVELPLYAQLGNRSESTAIDARIINGYVEKLNDQVHIVKRPGSVLTTSFGGSVGRGVYFYNGHVFAVVDGTLYRDGIAKGSVEAAGVYSFSSDLGATPVLFLHNTASFYTFDDSSSTLAAIASPPTTNAVPGTAFLDGTTYVMDSITNIWGSNINDLTTWDPLNVLKAQSEPDNAVALMKQLYYVIALKEWTCESFWDAGNPTGSPLATSQGSLFFYGCRAAGTLTLLEDCAIWVTATRNGTSSVLVLEGLKPRIVSTPPVERLLQDADFSVVYSWAFRLNGHRFYVLTLVNTNITLVYDLTTDAWFTWTDGSGNYLPYAFSTTNSAKQTLVQHLNGDIYQIEQTVYTDSGVSIPFEIYTPNWNGGTSVKKYLKRMAFAADQNGSGMLSVRVSDDDYQNWTNFRQVDLSRKHPYLDDCGTFRKRAWHLRYIADTAMRIRSVELLVDMGSI